MPYEFYLYDFQRMFSEAKNAIAKAKSEGIEIPDSLEKDLQGVEALHSDARKEYFTNHNEVAADTLLKKATNGASEVFHEALRLHLSGLFQRACDACGFFKGYDHLARGNITGYRDVHSKNLSEIKELLENWALHGKKLGKYQIYSHCGQLRGFLKDFKIGKPGLSDAIEEKEEEKREREEAKKEATKRFHISTRLTCVVIIIAIATLIVSIVGLKGCGDSSLQPAQSETELQSAENNSAPTP